MPARPVRPGHTRLHAPLAALGLLLGLVSAAPTLAQAAAQAPAPTPAAAPAGRVVELEVPAPSLAGNLVGTADVQQASVYLPAGYDAAPARRYPVIYLLHGIFDRPETWTGHFEVPAILDRLIAAGEMPPALVVMPTGGNRYGGGFYRDSPVSGRWAEFVAEDLVRTIDGSFRTLARAGGRALTGHSMGGYGAIHISMERPGVFASAYAMSPCCLDPVEDLGFGNSSWRQTYAFETEEEMEAALEAGELYGVAAMGIAAAFTPDPDNPPFYVDFPFEVVRGEVVLQQDEFSAYRGRYPVARIGETRAALLALRGLALDYGVGDQFQHIPAGTRELSRRLAEARVPHRLEVYAGDHRQQLKERLETVVFPYLGALLDPPEG